MERRTRFSQKLNSSESVHTQKKSNSKNVHFPDNPIKTTSLRNRHRSTSILKKQQNLQHLQNFKIRSDSLNSLAGQNPKDDQSCENNNLNKIVKDQYKRILQKHHKKYSFTDNLFPPNSSSLNSSSRKINQDPKIKEVKWQRLSQIFPGRQLTIIGNDPWKNFIKPSTKLAAEYFALALNCLKNNKKLLKKIFEYSTLNKEGIYCLKIFQGNVWKNIIVDDFIPVFEETDNKGKKYIPAFVRGQVSPHLKEPIEIWPYLLEKAYAKYYSSYQTLQSGNVFDFLEEVSNEPYEEINLSTDKVNLRQLLKQSELIIVGEEINGTFTAIFSLMGLSEKIFFLSTEKPGYKNSILPEDLSSYFNYLYVYGNHKYQYHGFCPIRQMKQSISIRSLSLTQVTKCCLCLVQKDQRFFNGKTAYEYSWIRIILLQKQCHEGYRWIDGRYFDSKSTKLELELEAGEYYVVVMPQWKYRAYDLTLILRTKYPIQLNRKPYKEGILEEGCADLAQRFGKMNQLNAYICSYNCIHEDLALIIENINNQKTKGNIRILRSIDGLFSTQPIVPLNKEFKGSKELEIVIRPNYHFTVVLMMKGGIDRKFFQNFDFCSK